MFVVILTLAFCSFLYFYIKHKERFKLGNKIPGPKGWPIIGNFEEIMLTPEEIFEQLSTNKIKFGHLYKFWILNELWVIVGNVKDAEILLTDQRATSKSTDYKFLESWLGTGLLTSTGSKWFKRRKAITPAFHFKILEEFVDIFDDHSKLLIKKFESFNTEIPFDIYDHITLCTLAIIIQTAMGVSFDKESNTELEYCKAIRNTVRILLLRMSNPFWGNDFIFAFTKYSKMLKGSLAIIQQFNDKVIQQRRLELIISERKGTEKDADNEDSIPKKKMALLDILLHERIDDKPLSDADIREEVNTFMFEGHDTTSSALIFSLYKMAQYQNVQQKVFEEIETVIGTDRTKSVSLRQLNELKYLEMVIKETLRLYPSVPYISRQIFEKVELSNGVILPPEANITIGIYLLSHDPKLFPNPEEFIPERFDPTIETDEKQHPFSYIPFSAGQRNCIGQKFAMLEMKTILSKILRYYIVQLPENSEKFQLSFELIIKVKNGMHLVFKRR